MASKMILSTIQSVVSNLSKPVFFLYANIFEANADLDIPTDSEGFDTFFVYIPPDSNQDTLAENGLIHTVFPLEFCLVKRLSLVTVDYKSKNVEPTIDEMRELGRQFIHKLGEEDVVENGGPADGITSAKYQSLYGWNDQHLFGVQVTCDVPIMEGKTGCT